MVETFGDDPRVLMLDIMDQPENDNRRSYGNAGGPRVPVCQDAFDTEMPSAEKMQILLQFIPQLWKWVDEVSHNRTTPVTIADWDTGDSDEPDFTALRRKLRKLYLDHSDIITFHHYGSNVLDYMEKLQREYPGRPVVLSSFMARDDGSTLDPILEHMYERNVWALHWGWVNGKIQTIYNSDSWNQLYIKPPALWHHDMLWANGTIYDEDERDYLLTFRRRVDFASKKPASEKDGFMEWARNVLAYAIIATIVVVGLGYYLRHRRAVRARAASRAVQNTESVELSSLS